MNNTTTQLRMSEGDKQQTYRAALVAMNIINQKQEALNKYRDEALTYAAKNPGNYTFTFNMDFMKVSHKLIMGFLQHRFTNRQIRERRILDESLKIAEETDASFEEVKKLFFLLMSRYIQI